MRSARLIVVLGSVNAIGPLSIDMYLPAFPEITRALDTSASSVQLTLTACVAGLALGQLVFGPLSDRLGRKRLLVGAMLIYAVASLLCASAPSIGPLIALRFVQGLAGAGGIVIARAVVRDLHTGAAAVRLFSSLMLVTGLAPILAPVLGGQLLALTSWEGIFITLAVLSALIAALAAVGLQETLPPERRSTAGLGRTVRTMGALLRDRSFLGHGLASGLTFGALFAYISGSSFVLQGIYGLSPQTLQPGVRDERARADRRQPGQRADRRAGRADAAAAPRDRAASWGARWRCSSSSPSAGSRCGPSSPRCS